MKICSVNYNQTFLKKEPSMTHKNAIAPQALTNSYLSSRIETDGFKNNLNFKSKNKNINNNLFYSKEANNGIINFTGLSLKKISNSFLNKVKEKFATKINNNLCSGEIPNKILKSCQVGEKGKIVNKLTGEVIKPTAFVKKGQLGYDVLEVYEKDDKIGYLCFKLMKPEDKCLPGTKDYIKDTGALYIEYMHNLKMDEYSHVGTLMHRLAHKISQDNGCEGKVILNSIQSAAPFHYDSGFKPILSYNPQNAQLEALAKRQELDIQRGRFLGYCDMYLPFENMEKLEKGEHCIKKEFKNESLDRYQKYCDDFCTCFNTVWDRENRMNV